MGELFTFFLPLALTQLMMSGGTPIVNAGIARRPDPVDGLAVFAVAFSLSVFINSLSFGLEPAAVAMTKGPRSLRRVLIFATLLGLVLMLLKLAVGLTPLGDWVFSGFFGLTPDLAKQASATLAVFAPMPFFLTLRSVGRGMLTATSHTARVGWGTLLRLAVMSALVFAGTLWGGLPGPILGAIAFLLGVLAETIIVCTGIPLHRDELPGDRDEDVGASYAKIARFVSPLLVAGLFGVGINSVINAVLTRTADANIAVGAFSVIRSVTWLFASMLISFQQLVIARALARDERRRVAAFAAMIVALITAILALLAYTPAGHWVMHVLIGVDGPVLHAAQFTLRFAVFLPVAIGLRSYLRGAAIRDRRSFHVLASSILSLLVATGSGLLLKDIFAVGAMVALVMWLLAQVAEILVFVGLRPRRSGSPPPPPREIREFAD